MEKRRKENSVLEALTISLKSKAPISGRVVSQVKSDFRKLQIQYLCVAEEQELCLHYSPGAEGCSRQIELNGLLLCNFKVSGED